MPLFVRNFSEAVIEPDELEFFQHILASFFKEQLRSLYLNNGNAWITHSLSSSHQRKTTHALNQVEANLSAFIQRMYDKYASLIPFIASACSSMRSLGSDPFKN